MNRFLLLQRYEMCIQIFLSQLSYRNSHDKTNVMRYTLDNIIYSMPEHKRRRQKTIQTITVELINSKRQNHKQNRTLTTSR